MDLPKNLVRLLQERYTNLELQKAQDILIDLADEFEELGQRVDRDRSNYVFELLEFIRTAPKD
jgi:hypothetical protein